MKKLLFFSILLFLFYGKGFSQIDSSINGELRRIISPLKRADCLSDFLYDLTSHTSNLGFYKIRSFDTSNTINWFTIYDEMYNSAYNLGFIPEVKQVFDQAQEIINKEEIIPSLGTYETSKIPLGLIDFEYNSIRPDAFDSINYGVWYFWNNDTIWDNPNRTNEPFETNKETPGRGTCLEIFTFSPLTESSIYRNVTFTIDPSKFFFYGPQYSANTFPHPIPDLFEIDFNDGVGWRVVDPYNYSEINVIYPNEGVYYPRARVSLDGQLIKHSLSTFTIETNQLMRLPDFVKWLPHLNIGVYKGCSNDTILKPIIYLEGIDPLDNRHIPEIYSDMIMAITDNSRGLMPMLLNYDYDFVVVSWQNSKIDMKINADAIVGLLDWLKTVSDSTHQFIVIGESMGGVIGRYALTYMETQDYFDRGNEEAFNKFKKWRAHNTRLFISLDAPHQGAFVPLAVQHVSDWFYTVPRPILRSSFFLASLFWKNELYKNLLKQPAVKQLLIQHRDTRTPTGEYSEHVMRTEFMNDLIALNPNTNGYPERCKLMAISNGLIDGSEQVGFRNRVITPNELMADGKLFIGVRIFKYIPIPLFYVDDFKMRTNPDGNGNILYVGWRFNAGNAAVSLATPPFGFLFSLKGCLTNLFKKKSGLCNILGVGIPFSVDIENAIPWETFPGGTQSIFRIENKTNKKWLYKTLVDYDRINGTIEIKRSYGVRFLSSGNYELKISADVKNWCFIPLQSALDYSGVDSVGNILPQTHNINANTVGTNILRTPFHIIMGWNRQTLGPNLYPQSQTFLNTENGLLPHNGNHLDFRNDPIDFYNRANEPIDHGIINREIGDFEMYLDNMIINREAIYQCEDNIFAGFNQHPYYNFPNLAGTIRGLNSDNQRFIIDSFDIGEVVFRAGNEIRLRPGFESRRNSQFRATITPMFRCFYTIEELGDMASVPFLEPLKTKDIESINQNKISVFPNPTCDNLQWKSKTNVEGIIRIYNSLGAQLLINNVNSDNGLLDLSNYSSGIYYLTVQQNSTIQYFKIIKR